MGFTEIADRVWVDRQEWLDLNIVLIAGDAGLVLVDTTGSARTARQLRDEVRRISPAPLRAVVNTHDHWDHVGGNGVLAGEAAEVISHENAKVPATAAFSSAKVIDLGDRTLELVHPGRGHTGGDLVVRVPDVDTLIAGDLVEESAPPAYGPDSYPLEWAQSLDVVLSLTTAGTQVVPGHGARVDRDFVEEQRSGIGIVAETIRDLAGRGVPADHALATGTWPFPRESLTDAIARGWSHLPRGSLRLPLVTKN
ncbi:MBL fold metallo-hydrolase [Nocardioides alcanivorans]|uniref:MBL fold metallo-hydrolase n=1 Tax=Nocardioides alcanivorans TaxID=2897352 RepID=UPI001F3E6AD6|nr:MBL fold metallo-hydrolase [Nocardioides alcanivorans]